MEWVIELISSTIFPVAMCILMAWYIKYTGDKTREDDIRNDTKTDKMIDAINNNTLALQQLVDKLRNE